MFLAGIFLQTIVASVFGYFYLIFLQKTVNIEQINLVERALLESISNKEYCSSVHLLAELKDGYAMAYPLIDTSASVVLENGLREMILGSGSRSVELGRKRSLEFFERSVGEIYRRPSEGSVHECTGSSTQLISADPRPENGVERAQ